MEFDQNQVSERSCLGELGVLDCCKYSDLNKHMPFSEINFIFPWIYNDSL